MTAAAPNAVVEVEPFVAAVMCSWAASSEPPRWNKAGLHPLSFRRLLLCFSDRLGVGVRSVHNTHDIHDRTDPMDSYRRASDMR